MSGTGANDAGAHGEQPMNVDGQQQVPQVAGEAGAGNGAGGDKGKGVAGPVPTMVPTPPGPSAQGGSAVVNLTPGGRLTTAPLPPCAEAQEE